MLFFLKTEKLLELFIKICYYVLLWMFANWEDVLLLSARAMYHTVDSEDLLVISKIWMAHSRPLKRTWWKEIGYLICYGKYGMVAITMSAANYKGEIDLLVNLLMENMLMVATWPQIWQIWLWDKD